MKTLFKKLFKKKPLYIVKMRKYKEISDDQRKRVLDAAERFIEYACNDSEYRIKWKTNLAIDWNLDNNIDLVRYYFENEEDMLMFLLMFGDAFERVKE